MSDPFQETGLHFNGGCLETMPYLPGFPNFLAAGALVFSLETSMGFLEQFTSSLLAESQDPESIVRICLNIQGSLGPHKVMGGKLGQREKR